jgi:hypothetical protein
LPKELTVIAAMLNKTYTDLLRQPNDHNAYTLGRVNKHNVIIACLLKGEIGNNNSATVAAHITFTFLLIKFGLLVSIKGGVLKSVRLSNVVVSTLTNKFVSYGDILSHMLWCDRFMPEPRFPLRFHIAYVTLHDKWRIYVPLSSGFLQEARD